MTASTMAEANGRKLWHAIGLVEAQRESERREWAVQAVAGVSIDAARKALDAVADWEWLYRALAEGRLQIDHDGRLMPGSWFEIQSPTVKSLQLVSERLKIASAPWWRKPFAWLGALWRCRS